MDILNWLYLKSQGLVRTQANDAKTDLVTLGAEVPFTTRGDGYQAYAMPLADAVHAGCVENNTYKAGIYDIFPWIIEPSMIPTCTRVEDTPAAPTLLAVNLVGYKIGATTTVNNDNYVVEYIGTVETNNGLPGGYLPWKTSGNVTTFGDGYVNNVSSAFASGALVRSLGDGDSYVPADYMGIYVEQIDPGVWDLYLVVASTTALDNIVADIISFEYEFLVPENSDIKFTIY